MSISVKGKVETESSWNSSWKYLNIISSTCIDQPNFQNQKSKDKQENIIQNGNAIYYL